MRQWLFPSTFASCLPAELRRFDIHWRRIWRNNHGHDSAFLRDLLEQPSNANSTFTIAMLCGQASEEGGRLHLGISPSCLQNKKHDTPTSHCPHDNIRSEMHGMKVHNHATTCLEVCALNLWAWRALWASLSVFACVCFGLCASVSLQSHIESKAFHELCDNAADAWSLLSGNSCQKCRRPRKTAPFFVFFVVLCASTLENTTNINQPRTEAIVTTAQTKQNKKTFCVNWINPGVLSDSLSLYLSIPSPSTLSFFFLSISCFSLSLSVSPSLSLSIFFCFSFLSLLFQNLLQLVNVVKVSGSIGSFRPNRPRKQRQLWQL